MRGTGVGWVEGGEDSQLLASRCQGRGSVVAVFTTLTENGDVTLYEAIRQFIKLEKCELLDSLWRIGLKYIGMTWTCCSAVDTAGTGDQQGGSEGMKHLKSRDKFCESHQW